MVRRLIACLVAVLAATFCLTQLDVPLRQLVGGPAASNMLTYMVFPIAAVMAVAASAWVAGARTVVGLTASTVLGCAMAIGLTALAVYSIWAVGQHWDILSTTTSLINTWHVEYLGLALVLVVPAFLAASVVQLVGRRRARAA